MKSQPLIVGCGNAERGDDAAGLLVARRLRERGIEAREHPGDALALLDRWHGARSVILVDAVVTGAPVGTLWVWDAAAFLPQAAKFGCSTHALGLADAIELARSLERLPKQVVLYGIEAADFTPGGAPSAALLAGVSEAAERIQRELARGTT